MEMVDEDAEEPVRTLSREVSQGVVAVLREPLPCERDKLENLCARDPCAFLRRNGHLADVEELRKSLEGELVPGDELEFTLNVLELRERGTRRRKEGSPGSRVKNRRYMALQRMLHESDYFSDERLEERDPLLFHRQVGRYLPQHAKQGKTGIVEAIVDSFDATDLLRRRLRQRGLEIGLGMQEESDFEAMLSKERESDSEALQDGRPHQDQLDDNRNELLTVMSHRFVGGLDESYFNYRDVDESDQYDDTVQEERDAEEMYFDAQSTDDDVQ
eukprot:Plantae.Rhodophyta-Purpureofilum_apyrenoidigerum.ctg50020.p1 GENE.Plantae.Rhodophyta-Purpureofilum_apyrenoidigerum.ctg50020~~Plantae.Rhodophyta-Purpureofilum_apyrenoidigerum.ctg50020.p1  ORF type:complete len:292 (-),score=63.86 Plantae.Rhodophyta-Purpureofilum_apyrenoidigerum.ctg50020:365-1183(-)